VITLTPPDAVSDWGDLWQQVAEDRIEELVARGLSREQAILELRWVKGGGS
jgi:hypothetical protein